MLVALDVYQGDRVDLLKNTSTPKPRSPRDRLLATQPASATARQAVDHAKEVSNLWEGLGSFAAIAAVDRGALGNRQRVRRADAGQPCIADDFLRVLLEDEALPHVAICDSAYVLDVGLVGRI